MQPGPLAVDAASGHASEHLVGRTEGVVVVSGAGGTGISSVLDAVVVAAGEGLTVERLRGRRLEQDVAGGGLAELAIAGDGPAHAALLERASGALLVVDDAQWLDDATLQALVGVVERLGGSGVRLVIGHRPSPRPLVGALTAATARGDDVLALRLGPLDDEGVATRVADRTSSAVDSALIDAVHAASGGAPFAVDALVTAWTADGTVVGGRLVAEVPTAASPALVDALRPRLEVLPPEQRTVLGALAIGPAFDDALLAAAAGSGTDLVPAALEGLRSAGLLLEGHDEPLPVVALAAEAAMPEAERRRLHDRVAMALLERGGSPVPAAEHLVAGGSTGPEVASALVEAAREAMGDAPEQSAAWLDRAVAVGAGSTAVAERARVALLVGDLDLAVRLADPLLGDADPEVRAIAATVLAVASAGLGRWSRGAAVAAAVPSAEAAAVVGLATLAGHPAEGAAAPPSSGPAPAPVEIAAGLARAAAAAGAGRHEQAVSQALGAADLLERTPGAVVLPETPHALGAMVAFTAGDDATAELLLRRAQASGAGGPTAADRHRLLGAWVALRSGRWAQARATVATIHPAPGSRDALIRHAVLAALARRDGDVGGLADVWHAAEADVLGGEPDLLLLELWVEIAAAAARLEHADLARRQVEALGAIVDGLGAPPLWSLPLAWGRLVVSVAAIDPAGAHVAADAVGAIQPVDDRLDGLAPAAEVWADVLDGQIDLDALGSAVEGLEAAGRSWEASRLAGHAAVRVDDASTARSLLTQARELKGGLPTAEVVAESSGDGGVLSDREREVARLVLDGNTHKEVGAQLYISPKTVEHHVAKIRQKLGASTRAEMMAALRTELSVQS